MRVLTFLTAMATLLGGVRPALAQGGTGWHDRVRASINFGVQLPSSTTFSSTTTTPVYLETATINTTYGVPKGQVSDGGILFRLAGNFGVGVAVSTFLKQADAPITGTIPHPFFFNTLRPISGTAGALQRSELVTHIQAAYVISTKRYDVALSAGPSIFRVSQDLVSDVAYAETYPYDTVALSSATVTKATVTTTGYNVGADVGFRLSLNMGVGGLVRYSRATVLFPLANSASVVSADTGGTQVAGGVRFFF
jgi:hypothetical protein